jgi:hypothetical protein
MSSPVTTATAAAAVRRLSSVFDTEVTSTFINSSMLSRFKSRAVAVPTCAPANAGPPTGAKQYRGNPERSAPGSACGAGAIIRIREEESPVKRH